MYKNNAYYSNRNNSYYPQYQGYQTNNSNNDRIVGGGFLGPFILGGLTGGLAAPYFYPRPYYQPYYQPYYPTYGPYPPRPRW